MVDSSRVGQLVLNLSAFPHAMRFLLMLLIIVLINIHYSLAFDNATVECWLEHLDRRIDLCAKSRFVDHCFC